MCITGHSVALRQDLKTVAQSARGQVWIAGGYLHAD